MHKKLLNIFFPKRCVSCGRVGKYICNSCCQKVTASFSICPICTKGAIDGITHPYCQKRYALDGLTTFFSYKGAVRAAIAKIKYQWVSDIAQSLIAFIPNEKLPPHIFKQKLILIPVPLHHKRKKWRGFNQSALLGKMLAKKFDLDFSDNVLVRKKNTKPQIEFKKEKRMKNIQGAFAMHPKANLAKIKNVILFDDVWTTGSTIRECGKVLKKAGVKFVWGLTIAN